MKCYIETFLLCEIGPPFSKQQDAKVSEPFHETAKVSEISDEKDKLLQLQQKIQHTQESCSNIGERGQLGSSSRSHAHHTSSADTLSTSIWFFNAPSLHNLDGMVSIS